LVLSSIDMFRNVSVPVWAATSKHSYCGWLRLLFWFPPPLLLLLLLLILLLVDVHISPFTRVRTLNSLSQPRLRATAFGWEASPKAPHLVALVLYFCSEPWITTHNGLVVIQGSEQPTCCFHNWGFSKMNEKCIPCPTTRARDQK
jgi:hypothetical protein